MSSYSLSKQTASPLSSLTSSLVYNPVFDVFGSPRHLFAYRTKTEITGNSLRKSAREDQALPRLCCTPVGTENPLGLLSASRNKPFEKSLDRAILLDLGLEVLSEAGDHLAGHRAGDLLGRRFACFVVLFDEESFIESLDYCVGFFVHKSV